MALYTWENAAKATALAYKCVLEPTKQNRLAYDEYVEDFWFPFKGIF